MEERDDALAAMLQRFQCRMKALVQVVLVLDWLSPEVLILDLLPNMLVRITLWTVGREVADSDLAAVVPDKDPHLP